jgi:hypothetical protein
MNIEPKSILQGRGYANDSSGNVFSDLELAVPVGWALPTI